MNGKKSLMRQLKKRLECISINYIAVLLITPLLSFQLLYEYHEGPGAGPAWLWIVLMIGIIMIEIAGFARSIMALKANENGAMLAFCVSAHSVFISIILLGLSIMY